jgi:broad specificity phosphatase PhoE
MLGDMAHSDPATMSMIYFVRHGQNLANVDRVLSHQVVDYSLTVDQPERGRDRTGLREQPPARSQDQAPTPRPLP